MNSSEQNALELSVRVYRRLLAVYPKGFRNQYEDPLLQAFGDLSRRALKRGGMLQLMFLWMRVLRDLATTAIREHLNVSAWVCPPRVRLRWVMACTFGFGIGALVSDQMMRGSGQPHYLARSLCMMVALGFLQSAWAFKRPGRDVLRWMAATTIGMFFFALPFRVLISGWPPTPRAVPLEGEFVLALLQGAGVGLFQYLMLPKTSHRPWRWIPANAIAFASAWLLSVAITPLVRFGIVPWVVVLWLAAAVYGMVTSLPLRSILDSRDDPEGVVQSR